MLKLRSMLANAEELKAQLAHLSVLPPPDFKIPDDPRITRVGRFLRATSIDELPQLFNVVRGQMSIVGPRPERETYVSQFEDAIHRYSERHRMKPGITGWAQVNGLRGPTSLDERVEWDNYYIENWSLWLDAKIMLMTFMAVVRGSE
jgi:lipopolysaccharide/colanic/teichoic acid biosynthesis glycosyltransferase